MLQGASGAASQNVYDERRASFRLGKALTMAMRGSACFDFQEYRARSHDLPPGTSDEDLWTHFVHDGQFEGRPFRWAHSALHAHGSALPAPGLVPCCRDQDMASRRACMQGSGFMVHAWADSLCCVRLHAGCTHAYCICFGF
jgi:hypothetical protein